MLGHVDDIETGLAERPRVIVLDFFSGRVAEGHDEDYLQALTDAIRNWRPEVVAPYLPGRRDAGSKFLRLLKGRFGRAPLVGKEVWGAIRADSTQGKLLVFPGPRPVEFLLLAAVFALTKQADSVVLLVVRRSWWGGRDLRGQIKNWLVGAAIARLIRSGGVLTVSDSQVVLDYWHARAGADGVLIGIPQRNAAGTPRKNCSRPVFGFVGGFRLEKGCLLYNRLIRLCLEVAPGCEVVVQLPEHPAREVATTASTLASSWDGTAAVKFIKGRLRASDYDALLGSLDFVVLPYNLEMYSGGTSGIMYEALAMGKTVLATRIPWGVENFGSHPNVIWFSGTDDAALGAGISEALREFQQPPAACFTPTIEDVFGRSWEAALAAARALLAKRMLCTRSAGE